MYFILKLFMLQVYPAYSCFKAIKVNDQTQFLPLLMYWITATSFLLSEHFADLLLFWIPFYTEFKVLVVLWITLPQTKGAIVLYADFIEPFLKKHEDRIDKAFIEIQDNVKRTIAVYGKQLLHIVNKILADLFTKQGRSMISDDANNTMAAESTATPVEQQSRSEWDNGWGYAIYSSLISRGAQLSASLQASAQNRLNNQQQQATATAQQQSQEEEKGKLERSDSYDSLGSFVASKKAPSNNSSSSGASGAGTEGPKSQEQQNASWGGYLGGWIWSSGNSNRATAASTPDNTNKNETTQHAKTD
ncbi:TB2/DP1, HVA22 family-domain-containing protein [Zychaea mexicana]|uniref:TB2/DP1, HVA22 family-domain-containing protein n=1 Tax=Zychaea mexicana TaxID=64656 RepID=UPI0022FDD60E|nr:TB2/DP1, HVA22 family-domain-containing protein [Zychaea mexicana]KAI9496114.1 TB2/DP1, HVA22 family-domain-containing protein [Zychaea mexicana]